ncbi:cobalamin biosynthesis protein [Alphaproteobacteria bacterium KMM 3653]|uniref:Cobalamin biosynthesis protein n=1 Tax=Harenicola maris TaxID=2841044 RepID=A0AAP2CLR8_9RHOB|nr:cobalamin biosynthesis protein [Harenicola maris]
MERHSMIAGLGFRGQASAGDLAAALQATAVPLASLTALATVESKVQAAPLRALAETLSLPVIGVPQAVLKGTPTPTHSPRAMEMFGTGSLAEAAALHAAGPMATLIAPRSTCPGGMATAAVATPRPQTESPSQ